MVSKAIETIEKALRHTGVASSDFDLLSDVSLAAGRILRPAAVLVPLIERQNQLNVILTKRASGLKHHPGQIAFPGGKKDPEDHDLFATALREASEEIALPEYLVTVLGEIAPHETVTGFKVTPVIGLVTDDFQPVAEAGEVAEIFEVPLNHLMSLSQYSVQTRFWGGKKRAYYTVPWGPYYIWGATARMLYTLAHQANR
ncbi:MAG: CoA pyrophosphatase [Pseudoruegeria sp.]